MLAGASRAGFYRYLRQRDRWDEEMEVRSEIQKIALEHQGRYGYRRMTAELQRRGMLVNHKRVARLMRADNLLVARLGSPDGSSVAPEYKEIYLNLANRMKVTGTNQVWVADISVPQQACPWRIRSFLGFSAALVMPRARRSDCSSSIFTSSSRPSPVASTLRHRDASIVTLSMPRGRYFRFLGNQAAIGV